MRLDRSEQGRNYDCSSCAWLLYFQSDAGPRVQLSLQHRHHALRIQKRTRSATQTEILAVIEYQGKVKSGGYAKYNIAENLNSNAHGTCIMTQAQPKPVSPSRNVPTPTPSLRFLSPMSASVRKFRLTNSGITMHQPSVLNASSRDLNMSRVDFHDDKLSLEMERINEVIVKFQNLSDEIKKKGKDSSKKMPELKTQMQVLEGEKKALQGAIVKL